MPPFDWKTMYFESNGTMKHYMKLFFSFWYVSRHHHTITLVWVKDLKNYLFSCPHPPCMYVVLKTRAWNVDSDKQNCCTGLNTILSLKTWERKWKTTRSNWRDRWWCLTPVMSTPTGDTFLQWRLQAKLPKGIMKSVCRKTLKK